MQRLISFRGALPRKPDRGPASLVWRRRQHRGVMVRDEPIGSALDDDEGEARRSRHPYSILEHFELIETDAHHGFVGKDDHVSFANRDLLAAFGGGPEIFANCLAPRMERGARYAVQEGV